MADAIKATLTPSTFDARPTTPVVILLSIVNTGQTVEQYAVEIEGIPESWYTLPDTKVALFPADHEDAKITILPSQEAGMAAGAHPFTITVMAQAHPAERTTVQGTVRVAASAALDVQLRPSRVTGRRARFRVMLRNDGNAPVDVDFDAYDSEEGCDFTFNPLMATVEPGRRAEVGILVRPLRGRLIGMEHSFDFRVEVKPSIGVVRPLQGHFIYKPRFRSTRPLRRLITLVVAIGVLAVAFPIILQQFKAASLANAQPNSSIGVVKLGATNPDAIMTSMGNNATMTNHDTLVTQPQKVGDMQAVLRQGQVVSLGTTSPAFKMPGNVHVGSTVADLKKAFGNAVAVIGVPVATVAVRPPAVSTIAATVPVTNGAAINTPITIAVPTIAGGAATAPQTLASSSMVVVGKMGSNGMQPRTYFDLNKDGTRVVSIRMGYGSWITADHGGPTMVSAITSTTTWALQGGPYLVSGDVRIPKGVVLTIRPGVHVFFSDANARLDVAGGTLSAIGTAGAPIIFTSVNDQQHGAYDTLMRPAPKSGDWGGLGVTAAGGTLQIDHAQIYYGGAATRTGNAAIAVDGTGKPAVIIQNSLIAYAKGYGIDAGAAPAGTLISADSFAGDTYPLLIGGGISIDNTNNFSVQGLPSNQHNGVYVSPSATIAANGETVVWSLPLIPFVLQAKELVDAKGTLELGPDVILKGIDPQSRLSVLDATLVVAGASGHPVVMTSYLDDAHGGDTNADGSATTPHPGDWRGLILKGTTRAAVQRLNIFYGGATGHPALGIQDQATAEISRAEIAFSATDGISNTSTMALTVASSSLHDNVASGIAFGTGAQRTTTLTGNTLANNGTAGPGASGQAGPTKVTAVSGTAVWDLKGSPYIVDTDVRITSGVSLTIQPGVHVFFSGATAGLSVDGGGLSVAGTGAAPVVFTSIGDTQYGTVDGAKRPAPRPGDWSGLGVTAAGGTLQIDHAQIYYGGAATRSGSAAIAVDGTGKPAVIIQNSLIAYAKGYGIDAGAAPAGTLISADSFAADTYPLLIGGGISIDNTNNFSVQGLPSNQHNGVYVSPSATIAANGQTVVWSLPLIPFVLQAKELVDAKGTLELGPDVILKGIDPQSRLSVLDATLVVAGERGHRVIMTSYLDDAHGGDTNADGSATTPHPGDWRGLILKGMTRAAVQRLNIFYGGATGHPALGIQDQATAEISRAEIAFSATDGISNTSTRPVSIAASSLHDNLGFGLNFAPGAASMTTVNANTFANNSKGSMGLNDAPLPTPIQGAAPTAAPPTPNMGMAMPADTGVPTLVPSMPSPIQPVSTTTAPGAATPVQADSATPQATPTAGASNTPAPPAQATSTASPSNTPTLPAQGISTPVTADSPTPVPGAPATTATQTTPGGAKRL